jgi:uracil-DNA glycosylase family 4
MSIEQLSALNDEIIACRKCDRLVEWREKVARERRRSYIDWEYWGKPVPGFGDPDARLLIIGLAPGAHGANRTGRIFTGDGSGDFLYSALFRAGFASQPISRHREDGLTLRDVYITAVCCCAPPQNKPAPAEISNCLPFLDRSFDILRQIEGIVALGRIAFDNSLHLLRRRGSDIPKLDFAHEAYYTLGEGLPWMLASYHPSRQNTQTGRLTVEMFDRIWNRSRELLSNKNDR